MCIIFADMTESLRAIVIGMKHVLQVNVARYRDNKICLKASVQRAKPYILLLTYAMRSE